MKYKRLTIEELKNLEQEFISFLAHAQITAGDWEKMKANQSEKANELIDVFSDVVYDKVLKKINFLEYRDAKSLNIYKFDSNQILLAGIRVSENSEIDLTQDFNFEKIADNTSLKIVFSEKKYIQERELEIFEMLQTGCLITNERLFDLFTSMR